MTLAALAKLGLPSSSRNDGGFSNLIPPPLPSNTIPSDNKSIELTVGGGAGVIILAGADNFLCSDFGFNFTFSLSFSSSEFFLGGVKGSFGGFLAIVKLL